MNDMLTTQVGPKSHTTTGANSGEREEREMVLNRKSLAKLLTDLEETLEAKDEALDNENDKDYPNDDRVEKLETEADLLNQLHDIVEEYLGM